MNFRVYGGGQAGRPVLHMLAGVLLACAPGYAVTCAAGVTHVVDTLQLQDGSTPARGKIAVKGPQIPGGSVVSSTVTITLGTDGGVDFCLAGGPGWKYDATFSLVDPATGRPTEQFTDRWIVGKTSVVQTRRMLLGGSSAPQFLISVQQLNPEGYAVGQGPQWDGNAWVPGNGGVGPTDPRLTDARTPTSHAGTHASGQADAITPAAIGAEAVDAKIVRKDAGGNVTIGTTCPAGTPSGSVCVGGSVVADIVSSQISGSPTLYVGQRFGVAYHFGLPTWHGTEDGSVTGATSLFAPTGLDIDQWLDTAVSVGARYVVLSTKWFDGFDLWPTKMTVTPNPPYSIAATAWYAANGKPDIVGLFVSKARKRGLNVGLYINFHDSKWQALSGKTPASDATAYTAWIEGQLQELLTGYGPIDALWVDGWAWTGYTTQLPYATILAYVHSIQPNCLLINNDHARPSTESQVQALEWPSPLTFPLVRQPIPTDVFASLASPVAKWFYDASCTNLSPDQTSSMFGPGAWANYTYTLSLGPGTDGRIPACQVAALQANMAAAKAALSAYELHPTSLSLGKTAAASTTYNGSYPASTVTDGDYAPATVATHMWISNDVTDQNPYVEIDLGSAQAINTVQIYNGPVASPGRLRDLTVTVCTATPCTGGNALYTSALLNPANALIGYGGNANYAIGPAMVVATGIATTGRYVRVMRTGIGGVSGNYTSFAVAEIAVF